MKIIYILFIPILISSCATNAGKNNQIAEFRTDTFFSINELDKHYTVDKYDSNNNLVAYFHYDKFNFLKKSVEYYNWGWYSTEFNDSLKTITQFLYSDTSIELEETKLNKKFVISNAGDTICKKSCYYELIDLKNTLYQSQDLEFSILIPCTGFVDNEFVNFSGRLTVTNSTDVFKLHDFTSNSNNINVKIGKLKPGKYVLYGKIYIYHLMKDFKHSDMHRILYIHETINVI